MDRRSFLRRSTIALAGGLLVGDAAIEAFDRLTHRKVFALGGVPESPLGLSEFERMTLLRTRMMPPGWMVYVDRHAAFNRLRLS